jgi:hypothetical protein
MLNTGIEAADLVDGRMAQHLYSLQEDPVRYWELWSRLQKQAEEMNRQIKTWESSI